MSDEIDDDTIELCDPSELADAVQPMRRGLAMLRKLNFSIRTPSKGVVSSSTTDGPRHKVQMETPHRGIW